jgi:hypothetical protein
MAKKNIYNNLINPQIKPEELDVSMFDEKKELDLSMFDDVVKKKGDSGSTSEVQVSESKESQAIDFNAPPPAPKFQQEAIGQPSVDDQSVDYLTPQQTKQKDDTVAALKEQLPFIKKTIADIDEKAKINIGGNVLFGFGKEQGDLLTARRYLKSAEKLINSPTEEGVKSFWAGIKRNDLTNLLSLGSTEAYRSIKTANIANKIKNGEEPTDEEYLVMTGRFMYDIANQNIDSPSSYRIGQAFAEMAPFIGQLYVSAPIGAAVSKAAASTTSKVISKEAVNILKKYGIDDVLKVATQAAAQTPFTPMLFQKYGEERMPSLSVSEEGKVVPSQGGESRVEAVVDAFGSTVSTIFSEKVGEVIKGRVTNWGKKAAIAMDDPTKALSSIQKFRKDANWSGLGYEFAEEQIDGIGQAITTEEATLSDLLDSKRQFETLATIMVAGGAMKAVEIPGYFKTKQYKKDLDKATELFKSRVDPHTVEVVDAAINTDDIDQMRERLQNEDLSYLQPEQQKDVLDYMKAKIENNVLFEAANTKVEKDENGDTVKEKTSSDTNIPLQKDTADTNVKIDPSQEIKQGDIPLNETENVVQEKRLHKLAEEYGFSVNEYDGKGQEGGTHSVGDGVININKNTTEGTTTFYLKGVQADMEGTHTIDLPTNQAILYHEIGHKLFSNNSDKGHSILKEIKKLKEENDFGHPTEYSVVKDDAFESMMEFFAFYKLAPDKLKSTQPRVYALMQKFDSLPIPESKDPNIESNDITKGKVVVGGEAVQEKPMFTEPEQEVKSEQDILKPTQQDILKPTQGEQAPIVESKEKETPKEAFQEVTVTDLLEKEETAKKSESSFLPFIFPINILASPRAKRRALDIKQVLKEQFLPSRGMPKAVYNEFLKAKGKINARRFDISRSAEDAKKKLYEAYGGKLTPQQKEEIEVALENLGTSKASKDIAFNVLAKNVPQEAQGVIEGMRKMIDSYSDDIKKLDMIGAGLEGKIDQNTGYYVTRTYRKHTDRDWTWDTIPLKIKEDAANKLLEIFPKLTADEALGMAKEMVESKDFSDSVIRKGNSLADIDQRSLKKRSLFLTDNPEIRALYGENRDPLYNYAVSLTRMAEIAERGKMLENIRDLGLTEGFLSETQSYDKNHIAQIQYNEGVFKGKLGTKPLSSYYTTPEIARAISNFMEPASPPGKMMRLYMSVITTTKIAKTAGSVKGVIRNFKSNITNALANGNWNIPQITSHITSTAKDKTAWNDFRRELAEENIVGDSSNAGELIKNVEELSNRISEVTRSDESFGEMLKRTTVDKALKVYGGADDIWKVYRYVSEKLKYKDAFVKTGMTEADAELAARKEASKILHKTSTYYSELPLFIQNMRKLPFTNTFVSFPYLTLTNYIGGIQQAVKEIKTPGLAHIGLQRLAGSLAATYVLTAISQFRNKEEGVDEKDLEAWRRFLPDYWRNDMITIKKDNRDGTAEYNNTSYMDYYGVITTPLAMLRRKLVANGTLTDEDLIDAATEFSKSFIGWDIAFDKLTQIKANQDDLGRQIFNPQDDWDDKWKDMLEHLWGTVEPGTLTDVKRMINTSREGGDWEGQLKGMLTGNQARTIDPLKSMDFYILPKYKRQMDNARAIYKNQLRQYKRLVAPGDADNTALQKAKERAEAISNSILSEVILDYDAAIRVGVKQDKLEDVIRGEKFDKDITNAILYRTGLMLDEEGGFLEDVSKTNN